MLSEETLIVLYAVEGSFVLLLNIPVILTIYFSSRLKKQKCLTLLGGLCIADTLNAIGFLSAGYYRISVREMADNTSALLPQSTCFFKPHVIGLYTGYQATSIMTLVVTFERVFAVFYPIKHLQLLKIRLFRVSIILFVSAFLLASVAATSLIERSQHEMIRIYCYVMETLNPHIWNYLLLFRVGNIGISVVLYILIAWKVKQMLRVNHNSQRYNRITVTIGLSIASALVCMLIPDVVMYVDPDHFSRYHTWSYLLALNKSLLNTFVYMLRHEEIRKALCGLLTKRGSGCFRPDVDNGNKLICKV